MRNANPHPVIEIKSTLASSVITSAETIKANRGRLAKISILNPGTTGQLIFNDAATVASAGATNQILAIGFDALRPGLIIDLDWPCLYGIAVSHVPTGGSLRISYE